MIRYFLLAVLLDVMFVVSSFAVELVPDLKQKADIITHGVDDTIMRINSGVCRVVGKTVRPGGRIVNDDILIAFDYHKHFYRFDNGKLIRTLLTPDFYYEMWNHGEHNASVRRSSVTDMKVSTVFCDFIDIQHLFCFVPVGPHKPYDYQNSVFHKQIEKFKILNYEDITNDLASVTIEYPNPYNYEVPLTAKFVANKTNGYTVQHIEYNCGYIKDISWKNINQTWVPVAYVFKSGSDFSVEWKIEWEQVNEKVDSQFFSLEEMVGDQEDKFSRYEGIPMFSEELGSPPIIIGQVGKGITSTIDQPKTKYLYFRYILITTGLILMFIAFIKMIYDRWKKKD